jgi:hypothetical protein
MGACRALLVGNSTFPEDPHNLTELRGPVNDLPLLRDALTDSELGIFEPADVRLLPERSKREITMAMDEFFARAQRDDVLLLYYTGHGRRDENDNLYLCARDTRVDLVRSTAISDTEINAMMRASLSRTLVVVLDCCYSGAFKGAGLPANLRGAGRFLITSSRTGQLSADAEDPSGASPFTRHLVDALKAGDLDGNGDGYVSLNDLYDFVLRRLQRDTKQIPERHFDHTVGDVVLARARRRPADGEPGAEPAGRPELDVSETLIEIRGVQPGEALPPEIVDVFNRGGGQLDWVAESEADWIRVEPATGLVRLSFDPRPGTNRGSVKVRDRGGAGVRTIRVVVEVLPEAQPPRLELSPAELDFGVLSQGAASPARSVQLANRGGGALAARVTASAPWIEARQLDTTIEVTVDTARAGELAGELLVESAGGEGRVAVRAVVASGPVLAVDEAELAFGPTPAGSRPTRRLAVANGGGGSLTWDFGWSGDFFTVTRVDGALEVALTGRGRGACHGSIWIRSDGGDATVDVSATLTEPAVAAGPWLRVAVGVLAAVTLAVVALWPAGGAARLSATPLGSILPGGTPAPAGSARPTASPTPTATATPSVTPFGGGNPIPAGCGAQDLPWSVLPATLDLSAGARAVVVANTGPSCPLTVASVTVDPGSGGFRVASEDCHPPRALSPGQSCQVWVAAGTVATAGSGVLVVTDNRGRSRAVSLRASPPRSPTPRPTPSPLPTP